MLKNIFSYISHLNDFEIYIRIASSFLVLAGLYVVLFLFYRILYWTSKRALKLGQSLHIQSISFIFVFFLWWLILDLPDFDLQASVVKIVYTIMIFLFCIIILDAIQVFIFDYYFPIQRIHVPQIIRNVIRALYFLTIVFILMGYIHSLDIRPLLTGSAIITAIIGLALQDTLGNLFSGLALHVSRPFDVGHWIKFSNTEGRVERIDWRSTTIKTREEDYMSIPNSQLAKIELVNYSAPTQIHGLYAEVGVRYEYPPKKIKTLLARSAIMTEGVVKNVGPYVRLVKYNDFSVDYRMCFFIDDYRKAQGIRSEVYERIWYVFKRNGIDIPFPIRDVFMKEEKPEGLNREEIVSILARVDFLGDLNKEELMDVAERIKPVIYSEGEKIICQGEMGNTFYIIKEGMVNVSARNNKGEVFLSNELGEGNFFGEISVLTGDPRTATVRAITDTMLLVLEKEDFELMLKKYPDMDKHISAKIAERQRNSFEKLELSQNVMDEKEAKDKAQKRVDSLSKQLLSRIRRFFSVQD